MGHIRDREFIRDNVPMTKEEVRAISIAKLELERDTVLLDVGAGSGSIGIEAATYIKSGHVYGIEVNPVATDLIRRNLEKFQIDNYTLIEGRAPKSLPRLKLNRMFIGGSKGNLEGILDYFLENSSEDAKVVINAIVLETLTGATELLKRKGFCEIETVLVNIARNKKIGDMNMMMGENPIYVISARRGEING